MIGADDALWLPNTERPPWLDGALPGDRGFDPLGLAKPAEYLQYDVDQLDQNKAVNKAGKVHQTAKFPRTMFQQLLIAASACPSSEWPSAANKSPR